MPSPSLTLSCLSAVALSLGLAASPAHAGVFEDLANGAGAVEVSGTVEVPLLRGVDTNGRPAVLAQGADKEDPDEFMLSVELTWGSNECTEKVAKALGGEIKERTLYRQSTGFASSTKVVKKVALVPELRIKGNGSDVVIRDWRCTIHKSNNRLALPLIDELAVAQLASKGTFVFTESGNAGAVLGMVGGATEADMARPSVGWAYGNKQAQLEGGYVLPANVLGNDTLAVLVTSRTGYLTVAAGELPGLREGGGTLLATGVVQVGGVSMPPIQYTVFDGPAFEFVGAAEADDQAIGAVIGSSALVHVDMAADPHSGRVALKSVDAVRWTDPTDKMLEDKREQFEKKGEKSASLLRPIIEPETLVAATDAVVQCVAGDEVRSYSALNANGIRFFGDATVLNDRDACPDVEQVESTVRAERAESDADPEGGDGGSADGVDKKEASRYATWGDALLKHGRFAEAFEAYGTANENAGEDCSYYLEYAGLAMMLGKVDDALTNATKSAELYDKWVDQSLETRLAVERGDDVPEGTYKTKQDHSCHRARTVEAYAFLAKGNHKKVEASFDEHMDLEEMLAVATAYSRLLRGQPARARGPLVQASNVGGRSAPLNALTAVVAARMGNERLVDANLDAVGAGWSKVGLSTGLTAVAAARESGGDAKVKELTERFVQTHPDDPSAWVAYGLEALRRGDGAAQAKVAERAEAVAQFEVDRRSASAVSLCEAAALHYVVDSDAAADAFLERAGEAGDVLGTCLTAKAIKAAVDGDAQATANALNDLAVRDPFFAIGVLGLLPALPPTSADSGAPE